MSDRRARSFALAATLLAAAATGGCSWLLGVSEDPVAAEQPVDGSAEATPDVAEARDGALPGVPDVAEAAVDDATVE